LFARLESTARQFVLASAESPFRSDVQWIEQTWLSAAAEAVFPMTDSRRIDLLLPVRSSLVRRAEDLMRARLPTPTGESDLCATLGVSGRTLRLAFRERFGMGPTTYFQTLRLHAARATLKADGLEKVSIAELARQFGFFHVGKFAGYYRRQFGEVPTKTRSQKSRQLVLSGK